MPPRKKEAEAKPSPKRTVKKDEGPSRADRAAALMDHVRKKMKDRAELCRASEYTLPFYTKRLPTGILTLDLALRGGWPAGAISQIIGPKNAGKDYLIWQTVRQLQSILGNKLHVLLAQTEMRADRTQGRLVGCAVALNDEIIDSMDRGRRDLGFPAYTKEERAVFKYEIGQIHEAHGYAVEDLYDIILRAVEARVYHLIVINSFGSIMSGAEAEAESMREKTYGGAAGPNTQFLHKLNALLTMRDENGEDRDTCIIGINQVRDDIKDPNKQYKAAGGKALEHAKFVDVFISSGKAHGKEMNKIGPQGVKQSFDMWGKDVNWRIEKGKAGMHEGARGTYIYKFFEPRESPDEPIIPVNNVDFYADFIQAGRQMKVIGEEGNWLHVLDEKGQSIFRGNGVKQLAGLLKEDLEQKTAAGDGNTVMNYIRQRCYAASGITVDYNWKD